jgi:hypothetical protein
VAAGLGNIQKVKDGERLSGRTDAASDFEELVDDVDAGGVFDDGDLPDFLK